MTPTSMHQSKADPGQRAINFFKLRLHHVTGVYANAVFVPDPWQEKWLREVFGTLRPDGKRKYDTTYLELPKKNGKTTMIAGVLAKMLFDEGEYGAEVYSAAATRDQAAMTYRILASMIRKSPRLLKMVTDKRGKEYLYDRDKRIYVPGTESLFQALSADADYNDGINPSAAVIDELHRHRNGDLLAVIDEGMATRDQPLLCVITTAGGSRMGVCWEWHEQARRIIDGTDVIESFHATIYAAADEANIWDEQVWMDANPALRTGVIDIEKFRSSAAKAKGIPSAELNFRRLRLNQWVAGERKWINMLHWKQCGGMLPLTEEALRKEFAGRECFAGVDLGESDDFAAYAKLFPWLPDDPRGKDGYDLVVKLYMPEAALGKRPKSEAQFRRWAEQDFIEVHPGDITSHEKIKQDILDDNEYFDMKDLGYDPWRMKQMSGQLEDEGVMVSVCRQSPQTMSEPSKLFERLLADSKINHGGHPVLAWMADNAIVRTDPSGNIRPDKSKAPDKMDGIVATVVALERATFTEDVPKKGGMTLYIPGEDADAEAS